MILKKIFNYKRFGRRLWWPVKIRFAEFDSFAHWHWIAYHDHCKFYEPTSEGCMPGFVKVWGQSFAFGKLRIVFGKSNAYDHQGFRKENL